MTKLRKADIHRLFTLLDGELAKIDVLGEVYLVGGAVMCLALDARESTNNVDAFFHPSRAVREAAARVGLAAGVSEDWLNDAVKGYLSQHGDFGPYLELPHLHVFIARPEYLLAMKSIALRLGEPFHDLDDVRYLLRYLNITTRAQAMGIVTHYFDVSQIPAKTRFAFEELLPE
jgi:hypothetical protein